jgi:hypothetical protein
MITLMILVFDTGAAFGKMIMTIENNKPFPSSSIGCRFLEFHDVHAH